MNTLYILIQHFIEDTDIIGVFSTEESAKKVKKDMESIRNAKHYSYTIQQWEKDTVSYLYSG